MARVFRMKFVPTIIESGNVILNSDKQLYDSYRDEIFKKFIEYQFVGTGWGTIGLKAGMTDDEIRLIKDSNPEFGNSHLGVFRAMCSIESNDLIWMIYKSKYYLFRVKENLLGKDMKDFKFFGEKEWLISKDISSCFTGEWIEIGDAVNAPGVIVNSMGIGPTIMEIKTAPVLSQLIWNKYNNNADYEMNVITEEDVWSFLTDRQIEGIVLTYIQVKYKCMVNTETLKHSTAVYECELVDIMGQRYYPQVKTGKTGDESLCMEFYNKIKEINQNAIAIVFFENEEYGEYSKDDFEHISKEQIWNFMMTNRQIMTSSVNNILTLYFNQ